MNNDNKSTVFSLSSEQNSKQDPRIKTEETSVIGPVRKKRPALVLISIVAILVLLGYLPSLLLPTVVHSKNSTLLKVLLFLNGDSNHGFLMEKALKANDAETVKFLLAAGGKPVLHYEDKEDWSILFVENPDIVQWMLESGAKCIDDDLWAAVKKVNIPVVRLFLEAGANPNLRLYQNYTILHSAVFRGEVELTQLLISSGAKINDQNSDGLCPLHYAVRNSSEKIIRILIEAGADLELKEKNGWSPLHYAAFYGKTPEIARILIKAGANKETRSDFGRTPLHYAARNGRSDLLDYLLSAGSNANAQQKDGWTPLHDGVINDRADIVQSLLMSNADPNIRNTNGRTPLHLAALRGNLKIMLSLLHGGAKTEIHDQNGNTPIDIAKKKLSVEEYKTLEIRLLTLNKTAEAKDSADAKKTKDIQKGEVK